MGKPKAAKPAQKPRPAKSAQSEPNGYVFLIHVTDGLFNLLCRALWPTVCALSAFFAYLAVASLAGKSTSANLVANILADWGLDKVVAYLAGASGIGYGGYERFQRMRTAKVLREQAAAYERLIDPHRTSSGLLPGGEMPPETR